jgi:hypothetical protein
MDMVTASPPVSPKVVQRILMIQKEKVTAATLLKPMPDRACASTFWGVKPESPFSD